MHGKRILVAGATGAVGTRLCEAFLALGGEVYAAARRKTALMDLAAELRHHERLHPVECDVADGAAVEALARRLTEHAPLDVVVSTVGGFTYGKLVDLGVGDVERLVSSNLLASAMLLRATLGRVSRGGSVLLVAAERALAPASGFAAYGAAKAGVAHLAEAAALEASDRGVRVNALLPGVIDTAENRAAMPDADTSGWLPIADLVETAVWLSGPSARAVNGALLRLPGA